MWWLVYSYSESACSDTSGIFIPSVECVLNKKTMQEPERSKSVCTSKTPLLQLQGLSGSLALTKETAGECNKQGMGNSPVSGVAWALDGQVALIPGPSLADVTSDFVPRGNLRCSFILFLSVRRVGEKVSAGHIWVWHAEILSH